MNSQSSTDAYSAISKALPAKIAESANRILRMHLISRGWPSRLANAVKLKVVNGAYTVEYLSDEAYFLEFGNERQRPRADVRKFLSNPPLLEKVVSASVEKDLRKLI